jgi:2-hydroxy-6-oxonona-2,4-dienedioate hydrolase
VVLGVTPGFSIPNMPSPKWLDVKGMRTCYYEAGSGEPVLFIYGGNAGVAESAECAGTWNLNFMPVAARFRAIAYDKPGQGYTDNPRRDEDYTIGVVVEHAAALISELGLPPVHVVGHSRGGYAATRLTLERPELIRSLTIINSSTLSPGVGTNEVVLAGCPHPPFTRESARWSYEQYCFNKEAVTDEWVNVVVDVMQQEKYRDSVAKMVAELLNTKVFLPHLAQQKRETLELIAGGYLRRPTQIFWGQNDRTAAIERGLALFRMIERHDGNAAFHAINRSGHFPFREQAQQFNSLLVHSLVDITRPVRT